eukprot:TRINITY_DN1883_c0_g1_i3.p1 TRINITY_DN1883_c0_g1~~TRINITY_DN1883_c0_g1_i3.p1  ORF type:complete len:635 (-),score=158.13 TRINITY_DN1883_c0_g1_i3:396-2300(-)
MHSATAKVFPVDDDVEAVRAASRQLPPPGSSSSLSVRASSTRGGALDAGGRVHVSLRFLLIAMSATMVMLVALATLVPTSVLWWTSLRSVSDVATHTTDLHLAQYRWQVVSSTTERLQQLLLSPVVSAQLLTQYVAANVPLVNHTAAEQEALMHQFFLPMQSAYWQYIWAELVAWEDPNGCQHIFRRMLNLTAYGILDTCVSPMMHYYYYNGTTPTRVPQASMPLPTLSTRQWWIYGQNTSLLQDDVVWCPPVYSVTPGEGKMLMAMYAFPEKMYPRNTKYPIISISFKITGINEYLECNKHSANGWVLLVDGPNYNLVASSIPEYIPAENCSMPAVVSPVAEVRNVVSWWIEGGKPSQMTLPGDVLLDVVSLAVPGGGISLRLFLITPRNDFLGDIQKENDHQLHTALATLAAVLSCEVVILGIALLASVAVAVVLSRPLLRIKDQLYHISNMDLELVRTNSSYSLITEVSKLQVEAKRMEIALDSFAKYVPRLVVKDLLRKQAFAEVGVKKTEATIFFLDIVDFTHTMDTRGVAVVIEVLKLMFERFSVIITQNQGIVDKYIGDSIMAIFNAPEPYVPAFRAFPLRIAQYRRIDEPVFKACMALQQIVDDLTMKVRIGMHHGTVYAGNGATP